MVAPILNAAIKTKFNELKLCGQRCDLSPEIKRSVDQQCLDFLQGLLQSGILTDAEDIGFCYWNISDNYAFLRNGDALLHNHAAFHRHLQTMSPPYLYWTVCDATQKNALENAGHAEFWWDLYREANEQNTDISACEVIAFAAHRAAMHPNPNNRTDHRIKYAHEAFTTFLAQTAESENFAHYSLIYHALCLHTFGECDADLASLCAHFYPKLALPRLESDFLCGEWQSFIQANSDVCRQARVSICAAVNALIDVGRSSDADKIYQTAKNCGLPHNKYIERRLYI